MTAVAEREVRARVRRALAALSDGREEDVTRYAKFESLDPSIAGVDGEGSVTGKQAGDVLIKVQRAGICGSDVNRFRYV